MTLSSNANIILGDGTERMAVLIDVFNERKLLLSCLPRSVTHQALSLLVVISACLTSEDYSLVGPFLWTRCFDWAEPRAVLSVRTPRR